VSILLNLSTQAKPSTKKKSSYLEQAIFDLHTQTHSHVELTGQILFTQLTAVNRT
jgi:hypothetical protein